MKISLLAVLFLVATVSANAQRAEKKSRISDSTQLVYSTPDGQIKDGAYYIQNTKNNNVLVQGNYKNDVRVGNWYFFSGENKLVLRYNYDQKKVAYIDNSMFNTVGVEIPNVEEEVAKNASAPVPLCAIDYYTSLLSSEVYNFNKGNSLKLEITAHVAIDGKATYYIAYVDNSKKTAPKEMKLKGDKFAIDWIPAMYNNQPIYSEFTVYATLLEEGSGQRRFRWHD
ncbi:hypothetical protein [Mucilaginibacter psychrotolerans]|uniref:Uncharacterized protein n=1 Tax=Mucilaginibacter psychrotolerans TaxID=1524096 RepID=A0A4Y8SNX8_9SPHI|nr:hypothetical protein [Mucilaginibacter psychrotolerans]TFF40154.1 hypothetical protein E2R66_02560 [Mucilaginibacter psychrotolerans]